MLERRVFTTLWDGIPTKDKVARARSIQGRMQMGKVFLPDCALTHEVIVPELLAFPAGKHDDIVDFLAWIALMLEDILPAPPPRDLPPEPVVPDSMDDLQSRMYKSNAKSRPRPKSLFAHTKKK